MAARFLIYFQTLLFISLNGFGQVHELTLKKIEAINNNYFTNESQIIQIHEKSKSGYVSDFFETEYLVNIGSSKNNFQDFSFLDFQLNLYLKADKKYYYYKKKDSVYYEKQRFIKKYHNGMPIYEEFNLKKGQIPGSLYFLHYLPISSNNFFSTKKYYSLNIIYQSQKKDTTIISQQKKHTRKYRKLFLDSNLHIFKIEIEDFDEANLLYKWIVNIKVHQNISLNALADSLDFGPFKKWVTRKPADTMTFVYKNSMLNIPFTNDSVVKIDTAKVKYFIIDFWYLSCKPCHLLRPELESIYKEVDSNKVLFVGFNSEDSKSDINKFAKNKGYRIPEINVNKNNFPAFGYISSYPTILILDTKFKVIQELVGYSDHNLKALGLFLEHNNLLLFK